MAGKAGQAAAAVPTTSTASTGETTPPANQNRPHTPPPPKAQPGQPPVAEQIGENPAAADRMAVAAQRAEIGTHNGTAGVPGQPGTMTASSETQPQRPAVVIQMHENEFQPHQVSIAAGQTVEWKNATGDPHTVTLVPDKALVASDAQLPRGAQPFDSGIVPAGSTFFHKFTTPGTYRYYCTMHEGNGMVGEVIVR
jgi:plastocyanin